MYLQKLTNEVEQVYATMPSAHTANGVAFDPTIVMVIIQAVLSMVNACKNTTISADDTKPLGGVTIGLKMRLRHETKVQYGKGWREVWQKHGNDMLDTGRQVASKATTEDLAGLRSEMKARGMVFSDDDLD